MREAIQTVIEALESRNYEAAYEAFNELPQDVRGPLALDWGVDTTIVDLWNGRVGQYDRNGLIEVLKGRVSNDPVGYEERVLQLEREGLTTSDAQSVADVEFAKAARKSA